MNTLEPKPIDYGRAEREPDAPQTIPPVEPPVQRVTVVDFNISLDRLVALFFKSAFAMLLITLFFGFIGFVLFVVIGQMLATQ